MRAKAARQRKWDLRYLTLAQHVSSWSKDPSSQVGAVIVDPTNRIVSMGYNGFPKGVADTPERYADRDLKYKMVVHAERNALLFAREDLTGCTIYTYPMEPCNVCASMIIQKGIKRVVANPTPPDKAARWADDMNIARTMFEEAGVQLDIIELPNELNPGTTSRD